MPGAMGSSRSGVLDTATPVWLNSREEAQAHPSFLKGCSNRRDPLSDSNPHGHEPSRRSRQRTLRTRTFWAVLTALLLGVSPIPAGISSPAAANVPLSTETPGTDGAQETEITRPREGERLEGDKPAPPDFGKPEPDESGDPGSTEADQTGEQPGQGEEPSQAPSGDQTEPPSESQPDKSSPAENQGLNQVAPSGLSRTEEESETSGNLARSATSDGEVLILGNTVTGGEASVEAEAVRSAGLTPVLVDDATWSAMTEGDFSTYRALVLGDPTCGSALPVAQENTSVWGAALDGNIMIVGTDPVYHSAQGGQKLTESGVAFAASEPGKTGAYITLSCYFDGATSSTEVNLLDGVVPGGFSVTSADCYNDAHLVATHPSTTGLSDADLSNWRCSVHEAFDKWPASFQVLAIAKDFGSAFTGSDGTVGTPYILAAGAGLKTFPLSASPTNAVVPVGSTHTITAELLDGATREPETGALLRAYYRPPGGGLAVTVGVGCDTTLCLTDDDGTVRFAYRSSVPRTDEVLVWHDQDADNAPDVGEPQVRVQVTWERSLRIVSLGDSYSSGEANPEFDEGTDEKGNRCHRSPKAWPRLLGTSPELHLACSGARTGNLLSGQADKPDNQGQLERLRKLHKSQPVDVVTVTIGGNNLGFKQTLTECFTTPSFAFGCVPAPFLERLKIDVMTFTLAKVYYPEIRKAAPSAKVLAVGYPQLFPDTDGEVTRCGWLSSYELREVNKLQSYLDKKMKGAAKMAGITFVSILDSLDGHELCSADSWIYDLGLSGGNFRGHPVELEDKHGQRAIAQVVGPFLGL